MANDKASHMAKRREGIWLGAAILGLLVMTVLVVIATYYFVASFLVGWQPEPVPIVVQATQTPDVVDVVVVAEVVGETAVSPTQTPTFFQPPKAIAQEITSAVPENLPNEEPDNIVTPIPHSNAYLIIPSLNVSQEITDVPIVEGEWAIDELGSQVGLLDSTGTHPGDDMAMAFIGHVTRPWPEISGPFADLILLKHGEEVIYRVNGTDYVYQVERIFRADPRAVDLLYVPNGEKIVLVTCSGWDFVDREYAERLITRAILVRTETSPTTIQ